MSTFPNPNLPKPQPLPAPRNCPPLTLCTFLPLNHTVPDSKVMIQHDAVGHCCVDCSGDSHFRQ